MPPFSSSPSKLDLTLSLRSSFAVNITDRKGEQIHQTLMAKKMQRLDESWDFRPFKFRIQAFTNAFTERVSLPPNVPSSNRNKLRPIPSLLLARRCRTL